MESVANSEKLDASAAAWLVRLEAEACTAGERTRHEAWLATHPRHRAAFMRVEAGWRRADQFRRLRPLSGAVDPDLLINRILPSLHGSGRARSYGASSPFGAMRSWPGFALAAGAAALVVGLVAWLALGRPDGERYTTDYGGFERVTLRDGSTVHMNTNSRIRVTFTKQQRRVLLERGEALFVVAPDPQRPFEVDAGATKVRAMGTAFSVRLKDARRVDVLVTSGRVAIDPPADESRGAAPLPEMVSTLSAGESLSIGAQPMRVRKFGSGEVSRKLGWMAGRVWFDRDELATAVVEFNRYNRRKLVIADPAIAGMHVGGDFNATDPESFVATLRHDLGIRGIPAGSGDDAVIQLVGANLE